MKTTALFLAACHVVVVAATGCKTQDSPTLESLSSEAQPSPSTIFGTYSPQDEAVSVGYVDASGHEHLLPLGASTPVTSMDYPFCGDDYIENASITYNGFLLEYTSCSPGQPKPSYIHVFWTHDVPSSILLNPASSSSFARLRFDGNPNQTIPSLSVTPIGTYTHPLSSMAMTKYRVEYKVDMRTLDYCATSNFTSNFRIATDCSEVPVVFPSPKTDSLTPNTYIVYPYIATAGAVKAFTVSPGTVPCAGCHDPALGISPEHVFEYRKQGTATWTTIIRNDLSDFSVTVNSGGTYEYRSKGKLTINGVYSEYTAIQTVKVKDSLGYWEVIGTPTVAREVGASARLASGDIIFTNGKGLTYESRSERFDFNTLTYNLIPSLQYIQGQSALVTLPNGYDVLAVGNFPSTNPAAEVYSSGAWQATQNSPRTREFPMVALMANGKVLMNGGGDWDDDNTSLWLYDISSRTWSQSARVLPWTLSGNTTTSVNDGTKVLIAGGDYTEWQNNVGRPRSLDFIYAYSNEATELAYYYLKSARSRHTATLLNSGDVFFLGGLRFNFHDPSPVTEVEFPEIFSPVVGTSEWRAPPQTPRIQQHTATLLLDGRVLVVGGVSSLSSYSCTSAVEIFDPIENKWTTEPSTNYPRCGHTATLLPDGRVLIDGGLLQDPNGPPIPSEIYTLLDP